jgi:CubicO group peptidase (beta-lactamase class C family)
MCQHGAATMGGPTEEHGMERRHVPTATWPPASPDGRLATLLLCAACASGGETAATPPASSSADTAASSPEDTGAPPPEDTESSGETGGTTAHGDVDFSAFDAELEEIVSEFELEGASVAVVHRDAGVIHERSFGAWEVDRRSLIASSSKVLSAGVLAHLADQGLLDLDAPISTYVGDWGERDHDFDPTVAQLLSNSSGMLGIIDNPAYPPYLCMVSDRTTLGACARTIYTARDARVTVAPDTEYHYGGAQWQLAGAIAEEVSGKTWNTLIDELYVAPCELGGLAYGNPYSDYVLDVFDTRSASYPPDGLVLEPSDNPNIEGGAYTSAGDYARVLLMHLRGGVCPGGRVLSEAMVARMQEDRIAEWGGTASLGDFEYSMEGYGLGWWLDRDAPGLVSDPGIFGATPWIDGPRGYGAMVLVEGSVDLGEVFLQRLVPLAAAAVDDAGLGSP